MEQTIPRDIKVIIGLGNPGLNYYKTRHSIGFQIIDELAKRHGGQWREQGNTAITTIQIHDKPITLIKPQTFMNSSGEVVPSLQKKGIKPENILVIHDELELPFGKIAIRFGGSHKGHNGLRSIIQYIGPDFFRLRFGIGRPEDREQVSAYVLESFSEPHNEVQNLVQQSANLVEGLL